MKKLFKTYAVIWAVLLVAFNLISFLVPGGTEAVKFTTSFWVGYAFITIAFIAQIGCTYFAVKDETKEKLFLNIPIIRASYLGLVAMFIFGAVCMAIPGVPEWASIILCFLVLVFNIVAVLKANTASEAVSAVEEKVKSKTHFIKMTTVNAENILNSAKSENVKAECKKVYEAIRYSDPMSNDDLSVEEAKITLKIGELATAVGEDNIDNVTAAAAEILLLVKERNNKCKALK